MNVPEKNRDRLIRLLSLCHGYPPYCGGAENAAAFITEQAAREPGIRAMVVTSTIGGHLPRHEQYRGIDIHRIPAHKRRWTRHTVPELLSFFLSGWLRSRKLHKTLRPDYVLAHFTMPAGMLAAWWKRHFGTPYSVILQGSDVPGYQPSRFGPLHGAMCRIARRVWSSADHVFAVGRPLAALAGECWSGPIKVIPNGVDEAWFRRHDTRPRDRFTILVVAQLIERKGIQYLLQALPGMAASSPVVHLCGTGPYEDALRSQAAELGLADQVVFHGSVDADRIRVLQDDSDVFVLPTLQEGLPLALLEAMASGMPVVATDVGDIGRVLKHQETGLVVTPGSVDSLTEALRVMRDDETLRENDGLAACAAVEPYRWSCIWRQYRETLFGDENRMNETSPVEGGRNNRI